MTRREYKQCGMHWSAMMDVLKTRRAAWFETFALRADWRRRYGVSEVYHALCLCIARLA
jgi:hypothetical protein